MPPAIDRPATAASDRGSSSYVGPNFSPGAEAELKFRPPYATYAVLPAIGLYLGLVGILLWASLARTGGTFVYAQDDPYIHLALARTLADHGVWGIRPAEFTSASSSPLWTLLLAALWKLGAQAVWVPFALNILLGVATLGVTGTYVARAFTSASADIGGPEGPRYVLLTLCALVLITPLPTLAFIGMEHTLQVLLVLTFAWQAAQRLAGERSDWLRPSVVAALMVATRYESLFLVAVAGAILLWQGRIRPVVCLGVAAAVPVAAFALYSVAHGGLVLPNSVLMKSGPGRFSTVGAGLSAVATDWLAIGNLFLRPSLLVLTLGVLIGLLLTPSARLTSASRSAWFAVLFLSTSLLHACLVKVEWFFRYEAYLMALGLLAIAGLAGRVEWPVGSPRKRPVRHPAAAPLLALLALPLGIRGLTALSTTVPAMESIYAQQVQMGLFFQRYYAGRSVAVNDIGAVAWYSTSPLLDIVGLASQRVADLKRHDALDAGSLGTLADEQAVEAVAVYETPFAAILPRSWVKVGEWTRASTIGVSEPTVAFLARTDGDADRLRRALESYAVRLPNGVRWRATSARVHTP